MNHEPVMKKVGKSHVIDMTPPPATALDTAGASLTLPQQTRKARETVLYQRTDARRQSVDKQIADLKASLDRDLAYIRNCIARGARDTALAQMRQAIRKQDRIKELADKWSKLMAADAVKAALEGPRPPSKIRIERKVKRYKMFSDD